MAVLMLVSGVIHRGLRRYGRMNCESDDRDSCSCGFHAERLFGPFCGQLNYVLLPTQKTLANTVDHCQGFTDIDE